MARLVTRSDLRTRVRRRADIEGDTSRFPDTELNDEINQSIGRLYSLLVSVRGAEYYEKQYYTMGTATATGTSPPSVTVSGAPNGQYTLIVDIVLGGALATATFRYSLDGGSTYSSTTTTASDGVSVLPETGLTLTFASGTYNADNLYTWAQASVFTTTSGTAAYSLPSDFLELSSLETTINGVPVALRKYMKNDRAWLRSTSDWLYYSTVPQYRIRGDARFGSGLIEFAPVPNGAYEIDMRYVPEPPQYTADTGTGGSINFEANFDEYVVLDVAIKCLEKDDLDRTALMARQAQVLEEIQKLAPNRDAYMPDRVTDVVNNNGLRIFRP